MEEIIKLIAQKTGLKEIPIDADIVNDLNCYGDDFFELIEEYSKKFKVDISAYLWYFHSSEEGELGIGNMFFKSPDQLVKRIPVTPKMLFEFAEIGKWNINYPEHKIPKKRYDLRINLIALIIVVALGIYFWLK